MLKIVRVELTRDRLDLPRGLRRTGILVAGKQRKQNRHLVGFHRLKATRGIPEFIRIDNGPEFISTALDLWAYQEGVRLHFSRPSKPTENAMIESFNGSFRSECLATNWFLSLEDARSKIERWRIECNEFRSHSSLEYGPLYLTFLVSRQSIPDTLAISLSDRLSYK